MVTGSRTRRTLAAAVALALIGGLGAGRGALAGTQGGAQVSATQSTASYKIELDVESVQTMLMPDQAATATSGEVMVSMSGMSMGSGTTSMNMSSGPASTGTSSMNMSGGQATNGMPSMNTSSGPAPTGTSPMNMSSAQPSTGTSSMNMSGGQTTMGAGGMTSGSSSSTTGGGQASASSGTAATSGAPAMAGSGTSATMTSMGDAMANHHLEVHVWDAGGNVVSTVVPSITIMSQATGASWTMDQIMGMYDIQVGQSDMHFGNNVHLDDGAYTITVTVGAETATFANVMVSGGGM
jgi:hypothetical protein